MSITIFPATAELSKLPNLSKAIKQSELLGFTLDKLVHIKELPGYTIALLLNKEPGVMAAMFQAGEKSPIHLSITAFFQDGSTHSVVNFGNAAGPPDPESFIMPIPGADLPTLMGMLLNTRKMGKALKLTGATLVELVSTSFGNLINHMQTSGGSSGGAQNPFAGMQDLMGSIDQLADDDELLADFETWRDEVTEGADFVDDDSEDTPDDQVVSDPPPDLEILASQLRQLETWWRQNDRELTALLRPGLDDSQIATLESKVGNLKLPDDVRRLYRWHDGVEDDSASVQLGADGSFFPLSVALQQRKLNIDALDGVWNPAWLPIAGDGEAGLFVVLDTQPKSHSGIYQYDVNTDPISLHYSSALGLIQTWLSGYQEGIFLPLQVQDEDYYEVLMEDEPEQIRRRYNTGAYPFIRKSGLTYFEWPED